MPHEQPQRQLTRMGGKRPPGSGYEMTGRVPLPELLEA